MLGDEISCCMDSDIDLEAPSTQKDLPFERYAFWALDFEKEYAIGLKYLADNRRVTLETSPNPCMFVVRNIHKDYERPQ